MLLLHQLPVRRQRRSRTVDPRDPIGAINTHQEESTRRTNETFTAAYVF